MYRPFISCDDPKGVVECGTIKKYRTSSHKMKDKAKSRRTAEDLDQTSFASKADTEEKASKVSTRRSLDPSSSMHLMEVSFGAQRLNNMIDSWSSGLRNGARSEDIAKDLLRGALDLQESLAMLRKVQEASKDMASLKWKQNEKSVSARGRIEANMVDRTQISDPLGEERYPMGFQRPWPSADGSSGSCREELKKVIKESLVMQNLCQGTNAEAFDSGSASEFHSTTSSSQSSWIQNERLSDSSFSPTITKKERGPNLVARLMGLEEVTSRLVPSVMQKQFESEKIVNQKRPKFEIDMPKVGKYSNPIVVEKVNPERHKTLKEVLETTHFNGLSKSSSAREHMHHVHHKQFDDLPPIVLIKPRCSSYRDFARVHEPVSQEELSLRKPKGKPVPSKAFTQREGSVANLGKEMEEHVSKSKANRDERTKPLREVVEPDAREIKPIENEKAPTGKLKLCSHASKKSQETETADKKAKVKTVCKKPLEKEISKPRIVAKSQDQGEISTRKFRKQHSGSRVDKTAIIGRKSTASVTTSKTKTQKTNKSKEQVKNQMKKQRPVAEPEAAKHVDEHLGQEKIIGVSNKDDCSEIRIIGTIAEALAMDREGHASTNEIREDCNQSHSSLGDDTVMLSSELQNGAMVHAEEACGNTNNNEAECGPDKEGAKLKHLLLTNQSFIDHAEELLNLEVDCPKILPKSETDVIANARLYLDCANELTKRKSLQGSQAHHPLLLTCLGNSRLHISLGKLVEEIHVALVNLTSYGENSGKKVPLDNIYAMMERDITCSGMINGIWNLGWRRGYSADEAEQVVNEVESLVLSGLIDELIVNL